MVSLVGVVIVLPEITGDVVSVVVVVSSSVVEVVEEPSSLLLQEMMVRLKRKRERIMSICFTWFPIGGFRITQYITSIGLDYKNVCGGSWRCIRQI